MELAVHPITALVMLDTLEISVNLLNVIQRIQPIQMFVQVMESVVHLTIAHVRQDIQELNVNSLLAF
jgi:uncharacterized protein YabN with tetrapyrrole methylase and pyrophosphatase domain